MERLVTQGIARETTGKRRDRLFVYDRYLSILNEGTEIGSYDVNRGTSAPSTVRTLIGL